MTFWEIIQHDFIFYIINLIIFVTVVLVTWLFAKSKQLETVSKLKTQLEYLKMQQNDKLFDLEDKYKKKQESLRLILKELESNYKTNDKDMVEARRNELSNVFLLEYKDAVHKYARLADQYFAEYRPRHREFVQNHIFPFLDTSRKILSAINTPQIMQMVGGQPIKYSYQDFDFAFDLIRKNMFMFDNFRADLKKYMKALGFKPSELDKQHV
ncbi:MAG: hypothetical protein GY810_25635 [Aureispira sp.]|nr:hypothetical protein [Aureispira sp.]